MALAVLEGRLDEADIARRVREFVSAGYRDDHSKYGPLSLDVPLYEGSSLTLGENHARPLAVGHARGALAKSEALPPLFYTHARWLTPEYSRPPSCEPVHIWLARSLLFSSR